MPQTQSYKTNSASGDRTDAIDAQASASEAFTPTTPGQALPKDGPAGWGVAARWFLLAILAVGFIVCLYVAF